jgi:hypothetical protein
MAVMISDGSLQALFRAPDRENREIAKPVSTAREDFRQMRELSSGPEERYFGKDGFIELQIRNQGRSVKRKGGLVALAVRVLRFPANDLLNIIGHR